MKTTQADLNNCPHGFIKASYLECKRPHLSPKFQLEALRVGKTRESDNEIEILALDKKGGRVIATVKPQPFFADHQQETAAFIVRAVNSHEALIKGLLELRDRLTMGQDSSGNSEINQDEIDIINGLLDKAEAQS